jgi:hypothetical protein
LKFLATAVSGNQPDQTFVITYAGGTTDTVRQSISDWFAPRGYRGESDVSDMAGRGQSNGTRDFRKFHVYGYSLSLRAGKAVRSITLPANSRVKILAISLAG